MPHSVKKSAWLDLFNGSGLLIKRLFIQIAEFVDNLSGKVRVA